MKKQNNLFDLSTMPLNGEVEEELLRYQNVRIKRIVSSDRLETNTFLQEEAEWVTLLAGHATLEIEGKCYNLAKGDTLFIPPLKRHTITTVEQGTIWLAIHIYDKESS